MLRPLLGLGLLTSLLAGCDCAGPDRRCSGSSDCDGTDVCVDGTCVPPTDAPRSDAGPPPFDGGPIDAGCPSAAVCGSSCCAAGDRCALSTCIDDFGTCASTDDCPGDTYCDASLGFCVPYGLPGGLATDETCRRLVPAGTFSPTVQCEFREAPAGDAFPTHLHVLSTPMVADFAIGRGPDEPARPSIVVVFDDGVDGSTEQPTGVIRILDGATCAQTAELGSLQLVSHSSPPAIGDLDGDGRPEIVAYQAGGGLVAFAYDEGSAAWTVRWRSTQADGVTPSNPTGGGWAGPALADLDDDGVPEVLRAGLVYDAMGRLLDGVTFPTDDYTSNTGTFAVVADVDADGRAEYVRGDGVWEWNAATARWTPESYVTTANTRGHVAVADFGDFPGAAGWPSATPEIAVISGIPGPGVARVQTLDGTVVFGPVPLPAGGLGGPPTIGDFDGDGRPELAAAGARAYSVFDLDCTGSPIGTCASGSTDGVLWSVPSQDGSSNRTGSSIFDFEGDGRAEAVYGDECFLRVYDGATGAVIFSQARSSCTWYENPVVADLDGDFNAEIVIGDNYNCGSAASGIVCSDTSRGPGLGPRDTDPLFPGLRCAEAADCVSGRCEEGFCRCTADAECCAGAGCDRAAFVCEAPPAGTPGTGNTCRASRPVGTLGIRVYRDAADNWVNSRRIWNQHAYFVTNANEDGTIPRTSAMASNWLDPELNNFRQNVVGDAIPGASPDLTTAGNPLVCDDLGARLTARVCNRGTEPVGSGVTVGFYVGDPDAGGTRICAGASVGNLAPGECESVECPWPEAPMEGPGPDIWVRADDDGIAGECREANNVTVFSDVYCGRVF
jgi:hypothetical protein